MSTWLYLRFFKAEAWGAPFNQLVEGLFSCFFRQCTAVFSWTWSRNINYISHQKERLLPPKVPVVSLFPVEPLLKIHHEKKLSKSLFLFTKSRTNKSIYLSQEFSTWLLTLLEENIQNEFAIIWIFFKTFWSTQVEFSVWVIAGNFANLINQPYIGYFWYNDDDKIPRKGSSC